MQTAPIAVDVRDHFIRSVVAGKSFADVGGLWGTVNEKVSVALDGGARSATMIDVTPPGSDLWVRWRERLAAAGHAGAEEISADVCGLAARPDRPRFEVVHCSGVLYHHPSPVVLVQALRSITTRYLILTSAITRERIENEHGELVVPPSGALFVPALDAAERRILTAYWRENAGVESCLGITSETEWDPSDFGPWWWLPTGTALMAMAVACGLRVVRRSSSWNGNASTLLLAVGDTRAAGDAAPPGGDAEAPSEGPESR